MADNGYIVSRGTNDATENLGDSAFFSALHLGAAYDCACGQPAEDALLDMLTKNGGQIWRHPSLPAVASLDPHLALYWAAWRRSDACPASAPAWRDALRAHAAVASLPPHFGVMLETTLHHLDQDEEEPGETARGELGSEMVTWALAVVADQAAAYRLHLQWLVFQAVSAPKGHAAWCAVVEKAKMPLIEEDCGRGGLQGWVNGFHYDVWEYALQRSPAWETSPDAHGLHTPAVDYEVARSVLRSKSL